MPKQSIYEFGDLRQGLYVSLDETKAPLGSARKMTNARVTNKGGISKRRGIQLLGDFNTSTEKNAGLGVFINTNVDSEIPIKAYDGKLEYYSPKTSKWEFLNDGYTKDKDFGFILGFARTGSVDTFYIGNAYEEDSKWTGVCSELTEDLDLLDTEVVVDSVFRDDIYLDDTASSATATTIVASADITMVDDQWNNFYVILKVELTKAR